MIIEDKKPDPRNLPRPTEILLHRASNILELAFEHDSAAQNPPRIRLSAEYLRINSPSAEVNYLIKLSEEYATRWPAYLAEISAAGLSREGS